MSRKRETQRAAKRELARHLGVTKDAIPEKLREHGRVTTPELKASLEVAQAKRGLLAKKRPFVVHVALYVVDAAGIRVVRQARFDGLIERTPAEITLTEIAESSARDLVRYTRPGHFIALAFALEGGGPPEHLAITARLADPTALHIALEATVVPLADRSVGRVEQPRSVDVTHEGRSLAPSEGIAYWAAGLVSVAAAHRVHTTARLPLHSVDGRLQATLLLDLRL